MSAPTAGNLSAEARVDHERIVAAAREIIDAIGEDPGREGLLRTPERIAEMYAELFSGLFEDPLTVLATGFEESHKEMVSSRTSLSTAFASITSCPSTARPTSVTCPKGVSSASARSPVLSISSLAAPRCRSD